MEYFLVSALNYVLYVAVDIVRWTYGHFFEFVNFVMLLWVLRSLRTIRRGAARQLPPLPAIAAPAVPAAAVDEIKSLNHDLIDRLGRQAESIEQTSRGVRTLQEQNFLFSDSLSKTLEYLEKLVQLRR